MIIEIPDFLSESEASHIISLAEMVGLRGSDLHLDEELEKNKEFVRGMLVNKEVWYQGRSLEASVYKFISKIRAISR